MLKGESYVVVGCCAFCCASTIEYPIPEIFPNAPAVTRTKNRIVKYLNFILTELTFFLLFKLIKLVILTIFKIYIRRQYLNLKNS